MGFYQKNWVESCSRLQQQQQQGSMFHAPTGHFPIPLILWLLMPPMVHGEGAEGGTGPLLSGTTTAP